MIKCADLFLKYLKNVSTLLEIVILNKLLIIKIVYTKINQCFDKIHYN